MSEVIYQWRHKETNEGCANFGEWSKWETCPENKHEEINDYISWGKPYETRVSSPITWSTTV